jgi:hypothetical protein
MKKLFGTFICIALGTNILIGQSVECVTCKGNIIDPLKVSSAIGEKNTSNGMSSFAGGKVSEASGDYSFAFGNMAKANALSAIALGAENQSLGMYSVAIGRGSICNEGASMALGYMNIAQIESSYLFGQFLKSTSNGNVTIGMGAGIGSNYLVNNKSYSLMVGFNSIYPTLFVEGKSSAYNDKTGKVGIGNITTPTAKLHIKADNNEDASLKLEPTGTSYFAKILLGDDVHTISAKPNADMKFSTPALNNFVFENGKVVTGGLQVSTSPGNGKLLQSDFSGNALWTDPAWTIGAQGNVYKIATGNVGIGVTTPTQKLEVAGNVKITSGYAMTSQVQAIDANGLKLTGTGGSGITVVNDGKVGIGTASTPTQKLEVAGNVKITSGYAMTSQVQAIDANGLKLYNSAGSGILINNSGNVGIGTTNPTAQLELYDIYTAGGTNLKIGNDSYLSDIDETNTLGILGAVNNAVGAIKLGLTGPKLYGENGNLGIGTTNITGYKLAVAGIIHAEEVKVEHADSWYDFVFDENYELQDVYELEEFIKQNKHLPDVPAEKEVKENGINLGEMNGLLLKKVEELTLYIIQQQKEIDELKRKLD